MTSAERETLHHATRLLRAREFALREHAQWLLTRVIPEGHARDQPAHALELERILLDAEGLRQAAEGNEEVLRDLGAVR